MWQYFRRELEERLQRVVATFPAVLVTGPRQAGKSTLLQHCLPEYHYVSFDDPGTKLRAEEDPELFLDALPTPLVIDEIQYVPQLLPYIKMRIDADRHNYGQFVLTGSQLFVLMQGVTESLAGRLAILDLYPFEWREIPNHETRARDIGQMSEQMVRGFFPELLRPEVDRVDWLSAYLRSYLERDVRNVKAITDLSRFQKFMGLLATRVGSLLNLLEVAKQCGVSHSTARDWLTILEATYAVYLLRPYFHNRSKQLIKSPKLYFLDTGLLCYLLGIDSGEQLLRSSAWGHIFENMVVMDWVKRLASERPGTQLYFYRTRQGIEVDLIVERGGKLSAFEIKFGETVGVQDAAGLQQFKGEYTEAETTLLCLRPDPLPLTREIWARHWTDAIKAG